MNNSKIFNKLNFILLSILIFIITLITVAILSMRTSTNANKEHNFHSIKEVELILKDGKSEHLTLPDSARTNEEFDILFDIADCCKSRASLSLFVVYADIAVYADGQEIYRHTKSDNSIVNSGGYYVSMMDIPDNLKDSTIRVHIKPLIKSLSKNRLPEIYVGDKSDIIMSKLHGDIPTIFIFIFMLFNFIIILILIFTNKPFFESQHYSILHLAILGVVVSMHFLTQLWSISYFLYNMSEFMYFTEYTTLFLIFIPSLIYIKYKLDPKFCILFDVMIAGLGFNILLQYTLTILKILEFKEMVYYTHGIIASSIAIIIISVIFTDAKSHPNKKKLIMPLISVILGTILPMGYYIIFNQTILENLSLIIGITIIILGFKDVFENYLNFVENEKKLSIYKELSITDSLTKLKNRAGYNKFIEDFSEHSVSGYLVSMDLNKLKYTNDTYGHLAGDKLIVNFANTLKASSMGRDNIKTFRIGGDEFCAFIETSEDFDINEWINKIKRVFAKTEHFIKNTPPSFSAGYQFIRAGEDTNIEKALQVADQKMYEDKAKYKSNI